MFTLAIRAADRPLPDGDLGARIVDGALELPERLASVLRKQDVRTAEQFVSFGQAFPSALAAALDWTPEITFAAVGRLARQLEMPNDPGGRPAVAFGARDPDNLRPL